MAELRALDDGIWTVRRPQRFFGVELGARMTVVRLPDGGLWLHSPVERTPGLAAELDALGPVKHVVAPNRFHHLHAGQWAAQIPSARLHLVPGLAGKRKDLGDAPGARELRAEPDPDWGGAIQPFPVEGMPVLNEVAFVHGPSRSLFECDLAFNVGGSAPPWTRWSFLVMGAYGRLATTPLERILTRDRAAARASLRRLLEHGFDRVVVSHGEIVESGGREAFRRAWAWLLDGKDAARAAT